MKLKLFDIAVFAMMGALMFVSKIIMEFLPNMHLIGVFIIALTVVYRWGALLPIGVFVILTGLYGGFAPWWYSYLYVWAVLWAMAMLIPQKLPQKIEVPVYSAVCGLHGFLFGALCAPAEALLWGFNFKQTIAWIISGLTFDIIHGVSNIILGLLIVPVIMVFKRAYKYARR